MNDEGGINLWSGPTERELRCFLKDENEALLRRPGNDIQAETTESPLREIHQFVLIAPPIPSTVPINKAAESDCGFGRILPECNVLANIPITEPHAKPAAAP